MNYRPCNNNLTSTYCLILVWIALYIFQLLYNSCTQYKFILCRTFSNYPYKQGTVNACYSGFGFSGCNNFCKDKRIFEFGMHRIWNARKTDCMNLQIKPCVKIRCTPLDIVPFIELFLDTP